MKRIAAIIVIITVFLNSFSPTLAYVPVRQTDWSGGYGQQVWSDSAKFHEYYHVNYTTAGEFTIDSRNQDNWYDPAWLHRRKISFNNKENGELTHFPVLIKLVHKDNFNYDKVHSQGNDIRFTDSDGKTIIPHDIEKWEETGTSYVWVKVPQILASSNDDYIYMYYGNPEAVDTRNPAGVFDNKFALVHHFSQTPKDNETYADATNKGRNGTLVDPNNRTKSGVDGKIGWAHEVTTSRAAARVLVSDHDDLDFGTSTDFTLEGWINTIDDAVGGRFIEKRECNPSCTGGYNFHFNQGVKKLRLLIERTDGNFSSVDGTTNINGTGWRYIVGVVYRRSSFTVNDMLIYLDGKRETTSISFQFISSTNANINTSTDLSLGIQPPLSATAGTLVGKMDEVRISNTARDPAWIKASYETVEGSLQTYGYEETLGGSLVSSIFDAGKGMSWGYLVYEADEPEKTAARVKVRTGDNMYLADAADFEVCDSIINKTDISGNSCVKDGHRYIQYQVILDTTEAGKTPIFKNISITDYLRSETVPVVKGVQAAPEPKSIINNLDFATPQPAPRPSPTPIEDIQFKLPQISLPKITLPESIGNFFDALIH